MMTRLCIRCKMSLTSSPELMCQKCIMLSKREKDDFRFD